MNVWFGKNNIMPYFSIGDTSHLDLSSDFDMDLSNDWDKTEVFLGTNGIGKSFVGKVIAYFAYIHANWLKPQDINISNVARALHEMGFGSVDGTSGSPILIIGYIGESDGLMNSYSVKIGDSAKRCFESISTIFYSNSQFPSNESFFSENATSLSALNVDVVFWHIMRKIENPNLFVRYGFDKNKANFEKETSFILGEKSKTMSDTESFDNVYYGMNRQIFEYVKPQSCYWGNLKKSTVAKTLIDYAQQNSFQKKLINISSMKIEDYITILFLQKKFSDISFELVYNSTPWHVLNSFSKYELIIKCLLKMSFKPTLLMVDEPENSMHLSIQEMIVKEIPKNCKYVGMTHSPEFVNVLLKNKEKTEYLINHLIRNETNEVKCERIDPDAIKSSLDAIAADLFGVSPNYDKWLELNPSAVDGKYLMDFDRFYEDVNKISE